MNTEIKLSRDDFAGQALVGLIASEAGEDGQYYGEIKIDPNTKLETYRKEVYPLREDGKFEDCTKPAIPCPIILTRPQHLAREAYAIADAMLVKRDEV